MSAPAGKRRPHSEARRERMAELERQMREARRGKVQGRTEAAARRQGGASFTGPQSTSTVVDASKCSTWRELGESR